MAAFDPGTGLEPHKQLFANQFESGLRTGKYMQFGRLAQNPHILSYGTVAAPTTVPALPTAQADQVSGIYVPSAFGCNYLEMYQTTAQTLMPTPHATKGMEIALDQVNNESVEYVPGGNHAANPLGYTAGTDRGVLIRAAFEIADADGMDQFGIGFRKQEAYAVPTSFLTTGDGIYTDFILFGFATAVADPNPLKISYDLNNSGSATILDPSFTVADGVVVTLEVWLDRRKASFFINGTPLGGRVSKDALGNAITAQNTRGVAAITVDSGDFFVPFIFCRQDAALTPVYLRSFVCGQLQAEKATLR